ncbi:toxin-antitoxin system YwqK family antitoxin [Flavobacterium zepuense]|nr:hypothetical protein [Flavobacterium zepuense]
MQKQLMAFVFFISICTGLQAQGTNKNDADGKRHGLWKGTYEASKRPRYEGTFDHGKETGTFKFFEDNAASILAATRTFAADGSCITTSFEKGVKSSEGKEVNKLREGEWKFYHPDGKAVMSIENYAKGKLTGTRKVFYTDGITAEEAQYTNGLKNGTYKKFSPKGTLFEQTTYKDDKLNGPAQFNSAQGQLTSKGNYTNDVKTGKWLYYTNGKLTKEETDADRKVQLGARKARPN